LATTRAANCSTSTPIGGPAADRMRCAASLFNNGGVFLLDERDGTIRELVK
jgi:hypothetical protein